MSAEIFGGANSQAAQTGFFGALSPMLQQVAMAKHQDKQRKEAQKYQSEVAYLTTLAQSSEDPRISGAALQGLTIQIREGKGGVKRFDQLFKSITENPETPGAPPTAGAATQGPVATIDREVGTAPGTSPPPVALGATGPGTTAPGPAALPMGPPVGYPQRPQGNAFGIVSPGEQKAYDQQVAYWNAVNAEKLRFENEVKTAKVRHEFGMEEARFTAGEAGKRVEREHALAVSRGKTEQEYALKRLDAQADKELAVGTARDIAAETRAEKRSKDAALLRHSNALEDLTKATLKAPGTSGYVKYGTDQYYAVWDAADKAMCRELNLPESRCNSAQDTAKTRGVLRAAKQEKGGSAWILVDPTTNTPLKGEGAAAPTPAPTPVPGGPPARPPDPVEQKKADDLYAKYRAGRATQEEIAWLKDFATRNVEWLKQQAVRTEPATLWQ